MRDATKHRPWPPQNTPKYHKMPYNAEIKPPRFGTADVYHGGQFFIWYGN